MTFTTMSIIYLALFAVMTVLHLYASLKKDQYFRGLTKTTLLLLLLGFYLESVSAPCYALVAALLFSWAGDTLLLGKGIKWFTAGGIAFMVSHVLFIVTYCGYFDFAKVPTVAIILLAAVFVAAVCVVFKYLRPHLMKQIVAPMFLYLLINGAMNCFALFRLIASPTPGAIVTAIGAVLFFVSDTALFFVRFNKHSRMKSHFLVMLTYTLGEFLIVLGLIMG